MRLQLTPEAESFIDEWTDLKPYIVAHTSGSTGKPKEIRLLKSDMRTSARATIKFFGLNSDSLLYLPLSTGYIAGKMQIVRALEAGCSLIVEKPSNHPLDTPIDSRISLLPIVPSQIEALLSNPVREKIDSLIIGGAPIDSSTEQAVIKSGLNAYATYGMTETCSHVALKKLGDERFNALPGISFSIDSRGCLMISSSDMSFGVLTTNDIIELHNEKQFSWIGRYDNVINSGGIKIFPEEIEKSISHLLPHGVKYYISSRCNGKWGEEAVLVCDSSINDENILEKIKTIVSPMKAPKAVIIDPQMKLTDSKKIVRRKF